MIVTCLSVKRDTAEGKLAAVILRGWAGARLRSSAFTCCSGIVLSSSLPSCYLTLICKYDSSILCLEKLVESWVWFKLMFTDPRALCYSKRGPQPTSSSIVWGLLETHELRLHPDLLSQNLLTKTKWFTYTVSEQHCREQCLSVSRPAALGHWNWTEFSGPPTPHPGFGVGVICALAGPGSDSGAH